MVIALLCFLGLFGVLAALMPLLGDPADPALHRAADRRAGLPGLTVLHALAVVAALIPNLAQWAKTQVDGALGAAGTSAAAVGLDKLAGFGVLYKGLESVGGGSVLAGMVLGAMAVYVIDNKMRHAAGWAFAGAALCMSA